MPELPEVETVKNGIAKFIGYAEIIGAEVRNRRFRQPVEADFEKQICHRKITCYRRIGKYIIIGLDNNRSIVLHLGMSGKIKTFADKPQDLQKHDHILIETTGGWMVFNDPRRFGLIFCVDDAALAKMPCFAKMGIDPFDSRLTGEYLYTRLQRRKMAIKLALLDQHLINGIGNIYASEILYQSRISPLRPSTDISPAEAQKLVQNIRLVLQKAIDNGGSTFHDYQKPDGSLGYFQNLHCVYNKTGQKCPDCTCHADNGKGIKKIVQGGRSTFYCPTLQK